MKFTNETHLDSKALRALVFACVRAQLDPTQGKNFKFRVKYRKFRNRLTYQFWRAKDYAGKGRVDLLIPKNYVPATDELAIMISNAIRSSYKLLACSLPNPLELAEQYPVGIDKPKFDEADEINRGIFTDRARLNFEERKSGDLLTIAENELRRCDNRMKARATRIKRAETMQRKDTQKCKYLRARIERLTAAHELAAAEAQLERDADNEREDEKFSRIR